MGGAVIVSSCKSDDPTPPPAIVGVWLLDLYEITGAPDGFTNYEGPVVGLFGESEYKMTFNEDETYTRRVSYTGPDFNDSGMWILEGESLTLDSDTDVDEEFTVEGEILETEMVLSQILTFTDVLPDAVTDTLTNAWANAHPESLDPYYQDIDFTILYLLEK